MTRRLFFLAISALTLAGCGSDSLQPATQTTGMDQPVPVIAGQWKASLNGDPISFYLEQRGSSLTGSGIRFNQGSPDMIKISGSISVNGTGSLQLLHQDGETDLDNERLVFSLQDAVLQASLVDGPGPLETSFSVQRATAAQAGLDSSFLTGQSEVTVRWTSFRGDTKTFRFRLDFPVGSSKGSWTVVGGTPLLSGTSGTAVRVSDAERGTSTIRLSVGNVDQAHLLLGQSTSSNSRKLLFGSQITTSDGLYLVQDGDGTLDFLASTTQSAPENEATEKDYPDLAGHWVAPLGNAKGIELSLEQDGGLLGGLVLISSPDRPQGATFRAHGGVNSVGDCVLNLSPSQAQDGDEVTLVLAKAGNGWDAKVYDQTTKLIAQPQFVRPETLQNRARLWNNDFAPFRLVKPAEDYRFDIYKGRQPSANPEIGDTRLFSIQGASFFEFVGDWKLTPDSKGPDLASFDGQKGLLAAFNPFFNPATSFVVFKEDDKLFIRDLISFPRIESGQAGESSTATWRVTNPLPITSIVQEVYFVGYVSFSGNTRGKTVGYESYGGKVTLVRP